MRTNIGRAAGRSGSRASARLALAAAAMLLTLPLAAHAQGAPGKDGPPQPRREVDNSRAPLIPFETEDFGKLKPGQNFGEILGVAVNSKGNVVILNHPGSAKTGPLYANASTELLEFDSRGNFIREIGDKVYGLGYAHQVRFDKYDNLWVVDKGTNAVIKFSPTGKVLLNLGRRDEGFDSAPGEHIMPGDAKFVDGWFRAPTDVAWDADDNIFVSDGYINSRIAKMTKTGDWIKSWGRNGRGGVNANENIGAFNNPHSMQADRAGNVYVGDRGNRRIQVFDKEGNFLRFLFLNAPYDKNHHPTLGNLPEDVSTRPNQTMPWAMCMTNTPTQYLYVVDNEPGRLYKLTLDGKIVGMLGLSGRAPGQFNWPHGVACPSENTVFVADMNNWRVQKLTLHPERAVAP